MATCHATLVEGTRKSLPVAIRVAYPAVVFSATPIAVSWYAERCCGLCLSQVLVEPEDDHRALSCRQSAERLPQIGAVVDLHRPVPYGIVVGAASRRVPWTWAASPATGGATTSCAS